jgi:1-aminocyclopropane-1-carboxylate deaminase
VEIIAVPVIKGMTDLTKRLDFLFEEKTHLSPVIFSGYEFGGYAKNTPALIRFMNDLYTQFKLPTDFVYTGKMMHAMLDKINSNYFPMGSTIICLHTGGLQGNESLTPGRLVF